MKKEAKLNEDILKITMIIKEKYPELLKYIGEMPVRISHEDSEAENMKNLIDYYESLDNLLKDYKLSHISNPSIDIEATTF